MEGAIEFLGRSGGVIAKDALGAVRKGVEEIKGIPGVGQADRVVGLLILTPADIANETGVVVAVEQLEGETDFTAVVLTDVTNREISGTYCVFVESQYTFHK